MMTRRFLVSTICAFTAFFTNRSAAQVSFHPVAAYSQTAVLNKNEREEYVYDLKYKPLPSFGLLADIGGDGGAFSTGLQFSQYGRSLEFISPQEGPLEDCTIDGQPYHCAQNVTGSANKTTRLQYLAVPLLLKYRSWSPRIKFYISGGLQAAYLLHSEMTDTYDYTKTHSAAGHSDETVYSGNVSSSGRDQLKNFHLSAVADGGIQIPVSRNCAITGGPHIEYGIMDAYKTQSNYNDFWNVSQPYLPYKTFSLGIAAGAIFTLERRHTKVR